MRWILLFLLATSGSLAAQSNPQPAPEPAQEKEKPPSLADLAKATRQKKQQAQGQTRVITNADLKSLRSTVTTGTAAPPPAPAEEAVEGEEGAAEDALPSAAPGEHSEEELERWRMAFTEARVNLQNAVSEGLVLQLRMNNLRNAYLRQADGVTQERIQAQLTQTLQAIDQNRQEQENARDAVTRLQQDARAAGLTARQIDEFTGALPEPNPEIVPPETVP